VSFSKKAQGITLLEVILVLAIVAGIIVCSFRFNQLYVRDRDVEILRANVDTIFIAMTGYYRANCKSTLASLKTNPVPVTPAALTIFLPDNWQSDSINSLAAAYILQFNLMTRAGNLLPVNANCSAKDCANVAAGTVSPVPQALANPPLGAILFRLQVAVEVPRNVNIQVLSKQTSADCISGISADGSTVSPCSAAVAGGNYLVWERLPSFSSPGVTSKLWSTLTGIKEFNLQYSHDQMFELSNKTYVDDGVSGVSQGYYTCGG
jgi:type II secretory pathway pseudopilin PulG